MSLVQLAVLSGAGREAVCARTLAELEGRGAAHVCASRTLFYSARAQDTAPELPPGWRLERREGPRGGGNDFRWMISLLDPKKDALLLEDDIQPCKNAVAAMVREEVPEDCGAISFYESEATGADYVPPGHRSGLYRVNAAKLKEHGYIGAQALRLPAWLVGRMQAGQFDPPHKAQDLWIGHIIGGLGFQVAVTCPSLVQHVGADSLCTPGATLTGGRAPSNNFPGQDFDALEPWPEAITPGPEIEIAPRVHWCRLHEMYHAGGVPTCPRQMP